MQPMPQPRRLTAPLTLVALFTLLPACNDPDTPPLTPTRIRAEITGGHQTDPVDRGRPVRLIAGALGVAPETFRDAFSNVSPARDGPPSRQRARRNKDILMRALGPHGITNDRLDEVSDYYRYRPQAGEMWPTDEAEIHAIVDAGRVTGFDITHAGSGYCSTPTITVPGHPNVQTDVELAFSPDFNRNGSIRSITLRP